tara:strand:- start:359 stop:757 length:399 start_codon:yes stop_codon:yes gene_type:complete
MNYKELSQDFFEYYKFSNWEKLYDLLNEKIEYEIVWNGVQYKGREDVFTIITEMNNMTDVKNLNLIEIIECGQQSIVDFKSAYFNRGKGEIENVRNCFLIKWNEQKIIQLTHYTNPINIPQKRGHAMLINPS